MVFFSLIRGQGSLQRSDAGAPRICLAVLFLVGAAIGYGYAVSCADASAPALREYLDGYGALFAQGGEVAPLAALKLYLLVPVLLFFLGFSAVGAVIIPLLVAACGFSSMFAIACFLCVYGRRGLALALAALGLRLLVSLPCILWLGAHAWTDALTGIGRGKGKRAAPRSGLCWLRFLVCIAVLLIGVALECSVTPVLFQWAMAAR